MTCLKKKEILPQIECKKTEKKKTNSCFFQIFFPTDKGREDKKNRTVTDESAETPTLPTLSRWVCHMAAAANQETHLCEACANSHPWNGQSSVSHYLPGYSTEARANPGQVGGKIQEDNYSLTRENTGGQLHSSPRNLQSVSMQT